MTDNFGPGVSRVLQSDATLYTQTVFQEGRPPLDSEFNLQQTLAVDLVRHANLRATPSGFLGSGLNTQLDFLTHPTWSNHFRLGAQGTLAPVVWANVNGYLIPVAGTRSRTGYSSGVARDDDYSNVIALDPPPTSSNETRVDFVFLEVWRMRLAPDSAVGKPDARGIWKYGNVEGGFSALQDEMIDPALGYEVNQRVQLQYRIRVHTNHTGLGSAPSGFDDTVFARGAASTPQAGFRFSNMRRELGDPGLWRAGNGTDNQLGTVDGYVYAIPIAAVFRRNSAGWAGGLSPNLNGAVNRNIVATSRDGAKRFAATVTLAADVDAAVQVFSLSTVTDLPFPATGPVVLKMGDEHVAYRTLQVSTTTSGSPTMTLFAGPSATQVRGAAGTLAEPHKAGTPVRILAGRPDGLFADQIASTDILDLRHVVNPAGFDYRGLLESNLDRLLRGELRAGWKHNLAGKTVGPVLAYQDAIGSSAADGTTKLDVPDNIRMVFSDAATVQPVEVLVRPNTIAVTSSSQTLTRLPTVDAWSRPLVVSTSRQAEGGKFSEGDTIVLDVAQLRNGLLPDSADQVRWLWDGLTNVPEVSLRFEGDTNDLAAALYSVTISSSGDLVIQFSDPTTGFAFRQRAYPDAYTPLLHIKAHIVYGPGRGLSRRPDSLHSVTLVTQGVNARIPVAPATLWSRYRSSIVNGRLPVTAPVYADLGSKAVIVTPFQNVSFPKLLTLDGAAANLSGTAPKIATTTITNFRPNGPTASFQIAAGTATPNDALLITSAYGMGRYRIVSVVGSNLTLDRPIPFPVVPGVGPTISVTYQVWAAQGLMPRNKRDNTLPAKYAQVDPLNLFTSQDSTVNGGALKNIYITLPRHLVPGWGEVYAPIVNSSTGGPFPAGVSFMLRTGDTVDSQTWRNYTALLSQGAAGYQPSIFSQVKLDGGSLVALDYNTAAVNQINGTWAGIRAFNDARGFGRQGLELPPFYGIARLKGVYQASDYQARGSSATNLIRQSMEPGDGPPFWIEIDDDLDSTFIINAKLLDISRAPSPIANFAAGRYVVEAVIFGFDRGAFDLNSEFRLLLTTLEGGWKSRAPSPSDRALNINIPVDGPEAFLPMAPVSAEQVFVNYSRTAYQGDAWGSQSNSQDIAYSYGPIPRDAAYQISTTKLNTAALARLNEKPLEVLSSVSFFTSLGTGRYSGDASTNPLDFRDVAWEDLTNPVDPSAVPPAFPPKADNPYRPRVMGGNFTAADAVAVGTTYLGCTERLPLGAFFRDHSFRGQSFNSVGAAFVYADSVGVGTLSGGAPNRAWEQEELSLSSGSSSVGSAGEILVHVDGNPTIAQLTSYRTHRGGSVYVGSGTHPGGPVVVTNAQLSPSSAHVAVLQGRALLVRNTVTNVGNTEVSAGDELMLLILTAAQSPVTQGLTRGVLSIGANGVGEGYAAADLYRISGHPLVRGHARLPDTSYIQLPPKS